MQFESQSWSSTSEESAAVESVVDWESEVVWPPAIVKLESYPDV